MKGEVKQRYVIRLLDQAQGFDNYYKGKLANHLPMGLWAIEKMGGGRKALDDFYHDYIKLLTPRARECEKPAITAENWQGFCHQEQYFFQLYDFLLQELTDKGQDHILRYYLPRLYKGLIAGAFHPAIRLSYGVLSQHTGELAAGLAYLADVKLPIRDNYTQFPLNKLEGHVLANINAYTCNRDDGRLRERLIADRMHIIAQHADFKSLVEQRIASDITIAQIAKLALEVYLASNDFTALHAVTGTQALRVLLPYIEINKRSEVLSFFAQGLLAAVLSMPVNAALIIDKSDLDINVLPDWPEIFFDALQNQSPDKAHVVKLVYSAYLESKIYKNDEAIYRYIATRKVKI